MGHWALVKLAVSVLPRGGRRDALLEHIEACSSCGARLAGRDEARRVLIQAENVGHPDGLRPFVENAGRAEPGRTDRSPAASKPSGRSRLWRWAAAAGGIGAAAAVIFLILGNRNPGGMSPGFDVARATESLCIYSASVAGRSADLYVVDVPEERMICVWVEKQADKGESS